ncbi:MAG: energy transducer TonB [Rheinheimera sp.]|nr:energy transducer TonB [Rheinheimera sp.]
MQHVQPILPLLVIAGLSACSRTTPPQAPAERAPTQHSSPFSALPVTDAELLKPQWQALKRFEPRYPVEEAIKGRNGCATVEYVITPDYQIQDLRVITATSNHFAKESMAQVKRWRWQELPGGILQAPVKTTSRFEYCVSAKVGPDDECDRTVMQQNTACTGSDVHTTVGYRIRKKLP